MQFKTLIGGFSVTKIMKCLVGRLEQLFVGTKETTLERAVFILQLLMFVTAEKEGQISIIFRQLLSPQF